MSENEYIPRNPEPITPTEKKTTSRTATKPNDKPNDKPKGNALNKFSGLNIKKVRTITGSLLTLTAVFLFISCVSFLFTWSDDQDYVLNVNFFDYIFNSAIPAPENWLGKFGAWMSHVIIYGSFGVSAFAFCFIGFLIGIKILFNVELLPLKKSIMVSFLYMVWGSLFLGYFSSQVNYLGGTFGYYLNEWLISTIGNIGTIALIAVLLYIVTTVLFNPNYSALFSFLKDKEPIVSAAKEGDNNIRSSFEDLHVVNTIRDEDISKDDISKPVHFGEDENEFTPLVKEDEEDESELIVPEQEENSEEDEFEEISITKPAQNDYSGDFEIEIPEEEAPATGPATERVRPVDEDRNLAEKLVAEHGVYDPTKDLEGYVLPPIDLLKDYGTGGVSVSKEELEGNKDKIVETLSHYKIDIAKIKATVGPTVTLYEIVPAPGVRISKIKNLEDDIALSLSALGIRIIAPIPGKGTIGIEVPNSSPEMVSMRSLIASEKFQNFDGELPIVMGKTITNETFVFDLTKMPHLLVAGATGQGKSVGLNAILISILYKKHPAQVKFVLVDPKKVELTLYNKIERHYLAKLPGEEDAIITDTSKVVNTLNSLCIEMDERYELLKVAGVRTIIEYNKKFIDRRLNPENGHRYLPYIVVLIDEFADLIMTAGKEVEHPIARIAQLARAIGIHLIVATQRPSVNVITGMIKANFPARIAFRVLSKIDSRTILDASGADQLIGRGDMLISTGSDMKRLQCGFVDTPEVEDICSFIGEQRAYPDALILPEYIAEGADGGGDFDMNEIDTMFVDSARIVVMNQQGSASLLQRKLKLGYNRAGRIVDQLEAMGIIGGFQGSKARDVLFTDIEALDEFLRNRGLI
jgi:S-DNA-T family DNA segregation ATPase FtsK/SpoIIIE